MKFAHILVILDEPNRPQTALKRAQRIAKDSPWAVKLSAVSFQHNALVEQAAAFDAKERAAVKESLIDKRSDWVAGLTKQYPELLQVQQVWTSDIAQWAAANAKGYDLIIKTATGSKRARSASDWMLLNSCPTHLLLVGHRKIRQPKRVLAALDLDHKDTLHRKLNRKVLQAAHAVTSLSSAELHAACAIEVSPALLDLDVVDERKAVNRIKKRTKDDLDKLLKPYGRVKRHFPAGRIGAAMADCVKEVEADLLVVGMRAHKLKASLGLGSSAQRIVRQAPCDVLAVKAD